MANEFDVPVSESVQTATKAVNAALVSVAGLAGLTVTLVSDGHFTGADVGTFVTALLSAVTVVGAVFQSRNKPKK